MKQQPGKRNHALWGFVVLVASALAQASESNPAGPTLVYSWPVNAGPLDPRGYSPNQMYAQAMVYEPLVRYTAAGTVEPWLATAWHVSDDGMAYTFTLRDGVRFSDGTPFDAAAAKANLDAVLANSQRHRWMELVTTLERVEAPGRLTLRLVLKHPYYPTLMELAQVRPLRFASPQAKPGQPAGTGPWVRTESRLGEFDRFRRNPDYWGPKPAYGEVMVRVIPDPNSRALALQAGEIELIQGAAGEITAGTFVRLRDQGYATALSAPLATRTLAMNTGRGATRDLAVRRAINEAVDKQTLIDKMLYGLEPRADTLFAPNMPYADLGLKPYPYDPAPAARNLDAAGWVLGPNQAVRSKGGEPLAIELVFLGTSALQKSLAEALQGELAKVGIQIDLRAVEEGALVRRQRDGDFGMIFADTWGAPYDPHSFVSSMRYAGHADYMAQRGLAIKDELDQRIGQVLASTDEQQRAEQYRYILTTLHEQAVYLPISYLTAISVRRDSVANVQFGSTLFDVPFEAMTPKQEP